jgi:hypothetical protein
MLYDNRLSKIMQRLLWWYLCRAKNNRKGAFVVFYCVQHIETGAWRSVGKWKTRNTRTPTLLVTNTVVERTVSSVLGAEREMTSDVR